mmetsp:Transcript_82226/g.233124  ORF Transcript_82226/g.233124 Transcript_82226/m.233124 type:complete len:407 (+) Transcript_82226:125-1345(+)
MKSSLPTLRTSLFSSDSLGASLTFGTSILSSASLGAPPTVGTSLLSSDSLGASPASPAVAFAESTGTASPAAAFAESSGVASLAAAASSVSIFASALLSDSAGLPFFALPSASSGAPASSLAGAGFSSSSSVIRPWLHALNILSSLSISRSHEFSVRKRRTSAADTVSAVPREMAWKRSTAFPPVASTHARSFPATSSLKFSYFSKALVSANCRHLIAAAATFFSRPLCVSESEVIVANPGCNSPWSSLTSASSWRNPLMRPCASTSSDFADARASSTSSTLPSSSFTFSRPDELDRSPALFSTAWTLVSRLFKSSVKVLLSFSNAVLRSETRALRSAASAFSCACLSSGDIFFTRHLCSWRAIPTADLSRWKLLKDRPLLRGKTNCWNMRSRFSRGKVKLNSFFA